MIARRTLIVVAAFGLLTTTLPLRAEEFTAFTPDAFAAANASGRPILVEISAEWCPTCKAQKPIISGLQTKPEFKDLVVLRVDFDAQKDVVRSFGATMQSTLITFAKGVEVGRSVGETDPAKIESQLQDAVKG